MARLSELPNIGKALEERLVQSGISDTETLIALGSRAAFVKLRQSAGDTCLSCLFALEGAVQGIRWHNLAQEVKADLKEFFGRLDC